MIVKDSKTIIQKEPGDSEFIVEANAQFEHYLIGNCGSLKVHVKRDALYSPFFFNSSDTEQEVTLTVYLDEPGAEVDLKGLLESKGKQTIINQVTIIHNAEHTSSSQYLKTMAKDESSITTDATVKITKQAPKSSALQLAKNLILSPTAQIKSDPNLEIDHDDVKASHGTSIGALDPESVFFLRSRGLNKEEAESMLIQAFKDDIYSQLTCEPVKQYLS